MKRTTLQGWTLGIWVTGFVFLEAVVLVAVVVYKADTFVIKATDVGQFESSFTSADAAVKHDADREFRSLANGKLKSRTRGQFRAYLRSNLPPQVEDRLINWFVDNCAEDRVSGLQLTYLQIYLPWLAVMVAGLLSESSGQMVPTPKARASIASSAVLQLLFAMFLVSTLLIGDLSATRNIELVATLVTALVGTLVQFVFPGAPEIVPPPKPSGP